MGRGSGIAVVTGQRVHVIRRSFPIRTIFPVRASSSSFRKPWFSQQEQRSADRNNLGNRHPDCILRRGGVVTLSGAASLLELEANRKFSNPRIISYSKYLAEVGRAHRRSRSLATVDIVIVAVEYVEK